MRSERQADKDARRCHRSRRACVHSSAAFVGSLLGVLLGASALGQAPTQKVGLHALARAQPTQLLPASGTLPTRDMQGLPDSPAPSPADSPAPSPSTKEAGEAGHEVEVPACLKWRLETPFRGYAYDHLVVLRSACSDTLHCDVATNANPETQHVQVAPGETKRVSTFVGSPARVFQLRLSCKEDSPSAKTQDHGRP